MSCSNMLCFTSNSIRMSAHNFYFRATSHDLMQHHALLYFELNRSKCTQLVFQATSSFALPRTFNSCNFARSHAASCSALLRTYLEWLLYFELIWSDCPQLSFMQVRDLLYLELSRENRVAQSHAQSHVASCFALLRNQLE